jgi:hypothetical protein
LPRFLRVSHLVRCLITLSMKNLFPLQFILVPFILETFCVEGNWKLKLGFWDFGSQSFVCMERFCLHKHFKGR